MSLEHLDPANLLEASYLKTYKKDIEFLWGSIVDLNTNVFILDKVVKFPFHLFKLEYTLFWKILKTNLYEMCILLVAKLATDRDPRVLILQKFKENVRNNITNIQYRDILDQELKSIGLEKEIDKFKDRIEAIRNKKIAHHQKDWLQSQTVPMLNQVAPNFDELRFICQRINRFFDLLCFSCKYWVKYIEYSNKIQHPPGTDSRSDIEVILDNLALHSSLLNMPEQQKEYWPHYRENLSEDDIRILNEYRRKFGLDPV